MAERSLMQFRDALGDLHEGPGTIDGEPLDGCRGCDAQAMVDEIARRLGV